jgi:hypothetical protein
MATLPLIHHSTPSDRRVENLALWILQWTLCTLLLAVGIAKFALSSDALHSMMPWSAAVPVWFVRFIAIAEITGAVGLVVPSWLRVIPEATPWAACGIVGMQWLALAFHLGRQEWFMTPVNIMLGLAAALIAWGRFNYLPIKAVRQPVSENIDKPGAIPRGMV